jgi:hypothetical protein
MVGALARWHCAVLILTSIVGGVASSRTTEKETNTAAEYENVVLQILDFLHDQSYQRRIRTAQMFHFDSEQCKEDLLAADADNDGALSSKEYIDFINIRSDNYFSLVDTLADFQPSALLFVSLFMLTACGECVDASCSCNDEDATIDITDAEDDTKNNALVVLCARIDTSLLQVMTEAPSQNPTATPTASTAPTPVPTRTASPTVFAPALSTRIPTPSPYIWEGTISPSSPTSTAARTATISFFGSFVASIPLAISLL